MRHINKDRFTKLVDKGAVLIDMRNAVAFRDGHIKGAKNFTLRQFTNHLMAIKDKSTVVIVYGDTFSEDDLKYALNYSNQLGFEKVYTADYHSIK